MIIQKLQNCIRILNLRNTQNIRMARGILDKSDNMFSLTDEHQTGSITLRYNVVYSHICFTEQESHPYLSFTLKIFSENRREKFALPWAFFY